VHKMPLLEVIVTPATEPDATVTAVAYGKKLGKTVIVVNDAPGFYTTRTLSAYMNEAGLLLEVYGLKGFAPRSELSRRHAHDPGGLVGAEWHGYLMKVTRFEAILSSHRPAARRRLQARRERFIRRLATGQRLRGSVTGLAEFGVFVRIHRSGVSGLVLRKDLSWFPGPSPAEVLSVGERVRVQVVSVEEAAAGRDSRAKIRLSLRTSQPSPWPSLAAALPRGSVVSCRVETLLQTGVLVSLAREPRLRVYVSLSELKARDRQRPRSPQARSPP